MCCASVDADRQEPNIGLAIGAVAEPGGTLEKDILKKIRWVGGLSDSPSQILMQMEPVS